MLVIGIIAGLYVFFFPTILARIIHHHEVSAVLLFNILIAWTIVGWFMTLWFALDVKEGHH